MTQTKIKAMLAHKYNEDKADYPAFIQPKLDGVRCLFSAKGAFSRAGNQFMNVMHIEKALEPFFAKYPNAVVDGELYNHGLKDDFEKIISLVRKKKPTVQDVVEASQLTQYHVYDIASMEYATYTDRNLFCKMLYDDGIIEHDEYTIYNKWFHEFTDNLNLSHIIYVNADPEICFQRILKRNREGEIVDIDYLERLHIYHEKWLNKCEYPVHTIQGNYDTSQKQYATKETEWTKECSDIINKLLETSKENKNSLLYTLYFAGYCDSIKKSKNKGATSYIICNNNNEKITVSSKTIENENISNNLLEYYALIDALEYIISNNINNIIIKSNSLVVIKQLLGKYKIKNDVFRHLHDEVKKKLEKLQKYKLQHVIDNSNREAITLAENSYSQSCKLPKLFCSRSEPKI